VSTGVVPSAAAWLHKSDFFFAVTWPIGLAEVAHRSCLCFKLVLSECVGVSELRFGFGLRLR